MCARKRGGHIFDGDFEFLLHIYLHPQIVYIYVSNLCLCLRIYLRI